MSVFALCTPFCSNQALLSQHRTLSTSSFITITIGNAEGSLAYQQCFVKL